MALFITLAIFASQTLAGNIPIKINGPGISPEGIVIDGANPPWPSFLDTSKGSISEPASDLNRYVLTCYFGNMTMNSGPIWFTILYVWDHRSERALVYLPGHTEIGYQVNSYVEIDMSYEKLAGKWYYFTDWDASQEWAVSIQKALPKINPTAK